MPTIPVPVRKGALETLSGTVDASRALPAAEAAQLLAAAHEAYTYAFEVTAAVSAGCAILAALIAGFLLRGTGARP